MYEIGVEWPWLSSFAVQHNQGLFVGGKGAEERGENKNAQIRVVLRSLYEISCEGSMVKRASLLVYPVRPAPASLVCWQHG